MKPYKHLTLEQRYQIYALLQAGHLKSEIARVMGVHRSTISRETERNIGTHRYAPCVANRLALHRRQGKSFRRIRNRTWKHIRRLLRWFQWSPQQISGRLRRKRGIRISHERIYQYIWQDKERGGDLHEHLRCRKKHRRRYGTYVKRGPIPNRVGIEERPKEADTRTHVGHWEADTIIGRGQHQAIVTLVERRSRLLRMTRVPRKRSSEVARAMLRLLKPIREHVRTITCDNGSEFAQHGSVASSLEAAVFFANPYASWERGTNENTNGLIRQYLPKGCDFREISDSEIEEIMHRLNNRPRKTLGYQTPNEVFCPNSPVVALQS